MSDISRFLVRELKGMRSLYRETERERVMNWLVDRTSCLEDYLALVYVNVPVRVGV